MKRSAASVHEVGRERAGGGRERVDEHGEQERPRAAEAVGDPAEEDAARRPADQERRGDEPGPVATRAAAAGSPGATPSSCGTQTGATKLNSRPSKTSKPQPSHAAKKTIHW